MEHKYSVVFKLLNQDSFYFAYFYNVKLVKNTLKGKIKKEDKYIELAINAIPGTYNENFYTIPNGQVTEKFKEISNCNVDGSATSQIIVRTIIK